MKKSTLLLVIITAFMLSACGSDEAKSTKSTSSSTSSTSSKEDSSTSTTTTSTSFSSFVKNVQDKKFAKVVGYNELYPIGTCSVSSDSWWIFNYSTNSCSETDVRSIYGTTVVHEYGDSVSDVESKLIEIINAASTSSNSYKEVSSNYYQFVSGDYIYGINLGYPSVANPVYRKHISTGENYFLLENSVQSFTL